MIDLDALEARCADGEKWLHDWYDGGGAPTPQTVAALVRAVRAAQDLTSYPFADFGRSEFEALEAALKPFQLGDS